MALAMYRIGGSHLLKSKTLLNRRLIHLGTTPLAAFDAEFSKAKDRLGGLKNDPGNQVKLQIYGLFKQATTGPCDKPKPGMMDFVGKAKWEAWNELGKMSQDDAQKKYIELVDSLVAAEGGSASESASSATETQSSDASTQDLQVEIKNNICFITMNRPKKKNAITRAMYGDFERALKAADQDDSVKFAVISGKGDFYSSGNDLSNFTELDLSNIAEEAKLGARILEDFVAAFINFNKPLIGLVHGPAVGISCTLLGLMDIVYCSDNATFVTPFSSLGQSPEGCSTYTFPKMMGSKSSEMLMFNKQLNAGEALERNLVTAVFPSASFKAETSAILEQYSKLPSQSLAAIKSVCRDADREILLEVNKRETEVLSVRWQSKECWDAVMSFFNKK